MPKIRFYILSLILVFCSAAYAADNIKLPSDIQALHKSLGCELDFSIFPPEQHDIAEGYGFYLVPCFSGAYYVNYMGYLTQNGAFLTPITTLEGMIGGKIGASLNLMNASYDPQSMLLSIHSRGRGIGDCGQSSLIKFEVMKAEHYSHVSFKTIEVRYKEECDGVMSEWPVIFKQ